MTMRMRHALISAFTAFAIDKEVQFKRGVTNDEKMRGILCRVAFFFRVNVILDLTPWLFFWSGNHHHQPFAGSRFLAMPHAEILSLPPVIGGPDRRISIHPTACSKQKEAEEYKFFFFFFACQLRHFFLGRRKAHTGTRTAYIHTYTHTRESKGGKTPENPVLDMSVQRQAVTGKNEPWSFCRITTRRCRSLQPQGPCPIPHASRS